ncbi:MAG TPA: hypothetical protein VLF68_00310 [Candidatus Saccharimonadales bacterium]|nr:hypothetical protein [Candidatus Saccharimonadales bacterium]
MEHEKEKSYQETDDGYSEKQLDIDVEIKAGEWQSLKKYKTYQRRSRQWKIIATYQAISNRLNQLVNLYYKLVGQNPKQGEKMLSELRRLRLMQEILLQCMVWEKKDVLTRDMVPPDVWEMIK